uniref:PTP36-D isoform n=1 Tax=Mus musculus TaxID=10090 RepID=Q9JLJ6_MOUSE|nr:PTP36-D isoform [Mus musculus]
MPFGLKLRRTRRYNVLSKNCFVARIRLLDSVLEGIRTRHPPIVVHCSAGVGRTGVVILSELMIYCLEHNEKVEVPTMLRFLREQRMFMIQTIAQYKFVYQVLVQFLQNSRLI